MIRYDKFKYMYPPRPEYIISPDKLGEYEGTHAAQVKMNGSCCLIFIKGNEFRYFGRHENENLRGFKLKISDLSVLNCGNENNWNIFVGEYMNKNKKGFDNKPWNHKFVIFDVLVYNGDYLLGTTFQERVNLLDTLFGTKNENEYLYKINENIYRVKTFYTNFLKEWNKIVKIDMLEGLVLKKSNAKLERGLSERNNILWQLKSRKETLNYRF